MNTLQDPSPRLPTGLKVVACYFILAAVFEWSLMFRPRSPRSAEVQRRSVAEKVIAFARVVPLDLLYVVCGVGLLRRRVWARRLGLFLIAVSTFFGAIQLGYGCAHGRLSPRTFLVSLAVIGVWNAMWFCLLYRRSSARAFDPQAPQQGEPDPQPTGDVGVTAEEELAPDPPLDEFEQSVLAELEKTRNPQGNWTKTLVILAVSLALFVVLGMRNNPIAFTVALVGVLFFHELGHYVGMRVFGYRNVRMFFIPFLGAAVSGRKTTAKAYQEAIVTLLGPLPGMGLALVLLGLAANSRIDLEYRAHLTQASFLLGVLNGFNLLPVLPFDGGRLLNQVLFSRNRYLESMFQILAAAAMIGYGATHDAKIFLFLGVWLLMTIGPTFKTNTIAHRVGSQLRKPLAPLDGPIPMAAFRPIVEQVQSRLPGVKTAKAMAGVVFRVWERMHAAAPGLLATLALLLVYVFGILALGQILVLCKVRA